MRSLRGMPLAFGIIVAAAVVFAEAPKQLEPLTFLLGEWETIAGGRAQEGTGSATFACGLQDRVMIRTSYAEYPATATVPASRHDDLMVIYSSEAAGLRADYYDNEGHVIHYSITVPAPGEAFFVSDVVVGAPRFRLTYKLSADGLLNGEFAIAPPGALETFSRYLAWESRKARCSGTPEQEK